MNQVLDFVLLGMVGPWQIILILVLTIGLMLIPLIFYLLSLQNTLNEIRIENRKMQPGQVWLSLIPIFGIVWQYIIVNRIADSLKLEFTSRDIKIDEERPGIGIGLAYCILFSCNIIPYLGIVTALAGLICWIIYWTKINDYKNKLKYSNA